MKESDPPVRKFPGYIPGSPPPKTGFVHTLKKLLKKKPPPKPEPRQWI